MADQKQNLSEEALKQLQRGDTESSEIHFSNSQKNMFKGFSENLYGNNWFVLSNNEGGNVSAICGVLDKIPSLSFKTELVNGPATKLIDKMRDLTGRGGILGSVGAATGSNMNPQISGNFTVRLPMSTAFQSEGFKLEFSCWKNPRDIFDDVCLPSDMISVISYLTNFATVETNGNIQDAIQKLVEQGSAGVLSISPIVGKAVEGVKATITDAAKKNIPGYSFLGLDNTTSANTSDKQNPDENFFDALSAMGTGLAEFVDKTFVRTWNDKQRITYGKTKFNETLHRLDVMRAGVLDTYLIVGIKSWDYTIDQSTLGQKMKVSIDCMIDQRMSKGRLKLYNEREMFG